MISDDYLANIDDMNLERILGESLPDKNNVIKKVLEPVESLSPSSQPSHPFWAYQLTLWGVED